MGEYEWDSKIAYLSKTRELYYNDDYLEFLVRSVWKINAPVRIVDFGCGYGYLGTKLMPLMPEGSVYTGIDAGRQLIAHAETIFREAPYPTHFILGDIRELELEETYDLAVCHAFLLHMEQPKDILRKMIGCLPNGGRIICFEPHWISTMANYYVDGHRHSDFVQMGVLQKLFERDAERCGKDGNIGMKLPVYLSQLGVKRIECRVSDKVNVRDPDAITGEAEDLYDAIKEDGFGADPGEEEAFVANLVRRGVSHEEAHAAYKSEAYSSKIFQRDVPLTYAATMKITTGVVER
ncbi:methyltransferase domain-containing protein [Paenibacillus whitsoniae]|uniref:Methyltransferase domain-containing protein n=1 Tax=Paenibacillus whitsoniae TaxID=2496558 RepID=A0A3S0A7X7_9BACL|nr:methyltransferase domain-containing protein [Paenibacillus whitsoniae]RTE11753.1 methyltransferase domain-containing protein [Paenibacillus whitsoniae]